VTRPLSTARDRAGSLKTALHGDETPVVHLRGRLVQIAVRETLTEQLVPVEGIATPCTQQRPGRHHRRLWRPRHRRLWAVAVSTRLMTCAHANLFDAHCRRLKTLPIDPLVSSGEGDGVTHGGAWYHRSDTWEGRPITGSTQFTLEEAKSYGEAIGIDWDAARFDVSQFLKGMHVELEHGSTDPATDVTGNDPLVTAKIALAHLNEFPDYYTRLDKLEREADEYWSER